MDPADAANTANAVNAGESGTKKQWKSKSIWQMPEEGEAVGILSISKINAELPVAAGATREQMKRSEGWVMQTDLIGSTGNAVVAGHRSYAYGRHFNWLGELAEGDRIFYSADGTEMEFAVDAVLTVKPDDPAVFALPQEGKAQLTLYTCTPVRAAKHRLIVRALRLKFGACEKEMLRHVRPPKDNEKDGEGFSPDEASDEDRRKEIYGL